MGDILNKSGTLSVTDLKDSWDLTLDAGKQYHYEIRNTGNSGQLNLKIKAETLDYGQVPLYDDWSKIENKVNVEPGTTVTGSFTAPRSVYGLSSNDPSGQTAIDSVSYIRVSVHWVLTIYNVSYAVRIYT